MEGAEDLGGLRGFLRRGGVASNTSKCRNHRVPDIDCSPGHAGERGVAAPLSLQTPEELQGIPPNTPDLLHMNLRGSPERELHQKEHGALKRGVGSAERTTEGRVSPDYRTSTLGGGRARARGILQDPSRLNTGLFPLLRSGRSWCVGGADTGRSGGASSRAPCGS